MNSFGMSQLTMNEEYKVTRCILIKYSLEILPKDNIAESIVYGGPLDNKDKQAKQGNNQNCIVSFPRKKSFSIQIFQ